MFEVLADIKMEMGTMYLSYRLFYHTFTLWNNEIIVYETGLQYWHRKDLSQQAKLTRLHDEERLYHINRPFWRHTKDVTGKNAYWFEYRPGAKLSKIRRNISICFLTHSN